MIKVRRMLTILGLVLGLIVGLGFATAGPASASLTYRVINYGVNYNNITVYPGWEVSVADSTGQPDTWEIFQNDCNDVIYRHNYNGTVDVIWASYTVRPTGTPCTLVFQHDGNKVIYHTGYGAIWATMTNLGPYAYQETIWSDGNADIAYYVPGYGWKYGWWD
jgi:hypothetical protein